MGVGNVTMYQDLFKSKILQASVPGRVKDNREGLVRRFHVAELQLVLLWEEEEEGGKGGKGGGGRGGRLLVG